MCQPLRFYHFKNIIVLYLSIFPERDVIADANILQGAIFHEDAAEESDGPAATGNQNGKGENKWNPLESRPKQLKSRPKPAAHRVN